MIDVAKFQPFLALDLAESFSPTGEGRRLGRVLTHHGDARLGRDVWTMSERVYSLIVIDDEGLGIKRGMTREDAIDIMLGAKVDFDDFGAACTDGRVLVETDTGEAFDWSTLSWADKCLLRHRALLQSHPRDASSVLRINLLYLWVAYMTQLDNAIIFAELDDPDVASLVLELKNIFDFIFPPAPEPAVSASIRSEFSGSGGRKKAEKAKERLDERNAKFKAEWLEWRNTGKYKTFRRYADAMHANFDGPASDGVYRKLIREWKKSE